MNVNESKKRTSLTLRNEKWQTFKATKNERLSISWDISGLNIVGTLSNSG